MSVDYSSVWERLLEKVKPRIPTIDSHSSSSEHEEIITVYERPAGLSLKVPEDFDGFSVDEDELEMLDADDTGGNKTATQRGTQRCDADVEAGACGRGLVEVNGAKLDASVKPNTDNTKSDEGFPVLSFARLDQWDLDAVLQKLREDGLPLQQNVLAEPAKTHADGDKNRSQQDIMQRLAALCNSQSVPVRSPNPVRSSVRMAAELQRSHQECPTVYIDLRCPDPSIKPPRTSPKLSFESRSPAKHSSHQETPPAKRDNLKVQTGPQLRDSEVTGKSMLLQKIKEMSGNGNKYPSKYEDPPSVRGNEAEELKVKLPQPAGSTCSQESLHPWEDEQSAHVQEASHLQSISTLPTDIKGKQCVLLIVHLSSPGVVGHRVRGGRKHLHPAATKLHIYNTLVAWFLSLVGPDPRRDEDEAGAKVPFWVAGLQQLWTKDGLALHVLAVARHCYAATDSHKPFYHHVCKFLSETPLTSLIPERKNLLDQQANASPIHLPSSCLNCFISATSSKTVIDWEFGLSPGFYWQTVETWERVCKGRERTAEPHTEVSVALGGKAFFLHPLITHTTLQRILDSGLDVCGLRLLYPPQGLLSDSAGAVTVIQRTEETCQPVLALAVRGPRAHSVLKDISSSLDPLLLGETDPTSLNSLHRRTDLLFVVSPIVPPCFYGQVLAVCEGRGFSLRGLQRLQLHSNAAAVLGLTDQQALVFCSPHAVTLDEVELPSRCLVLLLRKENAMRHSVGLPAVRFMWAVPDPSHVILSHQKCSSNSKREQVVILTLCGKDMSQGLSLLHRVLTEGTEGDARHAGFELLGLKYLPALTQFQAQELSPYEVGEQFYHSSLDSLMSSPALMCALRQVNAFASLRKLLPHDYPADLSALMSPTPEVACRQASLFFFEHEMIPVHKLQLSGLTLVGLRVVTLDRSNATSLLPAQKAHVKYLCSGSSLALCLEGENAVRRLLDVLSQRDSSQWTTGCGMAHSYNGIYGSGSYQKAVQDVKRLFPEGLCCTETSTMRQEQILSVCSDPLASVEREQSSTLAPVAQESLPPSVASGPNGGTQMIHRTAWQTTCLLIPFHAPPLSPEPSQLDMLEQLLRSGCHLVAGRMSTLDEKQRNHIAEILKMSSRGSERMARLSSAPCLITALQGETTVTRFDSILESIYKERSDLEKVGEKMIYPESEKEAKQLICYLFDALSPDSCHSIVP
ncbi:dynein axonemal assembly factor 8 [Symphorus nematophorus]